MSIASETISFIRSLYGDGNIALHRPVFEGNEKRYLSECIDSNFVSSVGERVVAFERHVAHFVGAKFAVATMNGTAALHAALLLSGVKSGDEVITQALSFIATCNALSYAGALPVFVDVDEDTLGMSPNALSKFLDKYAEIREGQCVNKSTGNRIAACVPMHTFGQVCRVDEIARICGQWGIALIEDAAESLGSYLGGKHTGNFGVMATLSFNGNKVITTGGGGMIVTNEEEVARRAKHITTTAKIPHPFEFVHDEVGYNYRLPNLNAALGCAQMEQLPGFLTAKRAIAEEYAAFFGKRGVRFVTERADTRANYWLCAVICESLAQRNEFLTETNAAGVMTRPIWRLMSTLPMYEKCQQDDLLVSKWLEQRVVNIPSSVPQSSTFGSKL